jgi:glycogen debranching enzyme
VTSPQTRLAKGDDAYDQAIALLRRSATESGFVASPALANYAVIWARDAAITSLGALISGEDPLVEAAIASLDTMGGARSPLGQIAAVVRPAQGTWDWVEAGVVDATAWYVILAGAVLAATGRTDLVEPHWEGITAGLAWLRHQDVTGSGLISAAPATDWMDSSLTRSGRTLNLNVLYYWAAAAATRIASALDREAPADAEDISWRINTLFWPRETEGPEQLFKGSGVPYIPDEFPHEATVRSFAAAAARERSHYVSHVVHAMFNEECDVLANLLAVCIAVADQERSHLILDHLDELGVTLPYPSRTLGAAIGDSSGSAMRILDAETYMNPRWTNPPYSYHNAGIWPFVGGFHVTALALGSRPDEASHLLSRLAAANHAGIEGPWGFHEWLHGETGEPSGAPDQAWSAGMYVLAHHAVEDPDRIRSFLGGAWR